MELDKTVGFEYREKPGINTDTALLVVFEAACGVRTINLRDFKKSRISFGRLEDNDIVINSRVVSRHHHGYFTIRDGRVFIEDDPNSTNGLLYRERLFTSKELNDGDIIRIDKVVKGDGESAGSRRQQDGEGVLFLFSRSENAFGWQFFPIAGRNRFRIGRGDDCDLSLKHPCISKLHAVIERQGDQWSITDCHSANGIIVNGNLISGRQYLYEKDVILLAGAELVFSEQGIHYLMNRYGISVVAEGVVKQVGRKRLTICDHANLFVKPGELVAIIGGSGSGKSTLMNCLCGYSRPTSGSVKLNGEDLYENLNIFRNIIGYVPQEDIVFNNLTVQSMLEYTARLRLPEDTSDEERDERVRNVIEMVELRGKEQTFIKRLSGGQKKRVSIAVELISDPSLLFLDEPTSGLDPGTEQNLMQTLRKMARAGKTIILVTHSTLQLKLCDRIAFMGRGGKLCYCGGYADAAAFFHKQNIIDIYQLMATEPDVWKGVYDRQYGSANTTGDFGDGNIRIKKKSAYKQLLVLCRRNLSLLKNDLQRVLLLFLQAPLLACLIYLVSDGEQFEQYEMTKSLLFALACSAFWLGTLNSIQEICKERTILKREYMTGVHLSSFVLSKLLVFGLVCAIQSVCMVITFIMLCGSPKEGILFGASTEFLITTFLTAMAATAMGLFVSALFKNADRAMTVAPLLLMPQILFSGLVFTLSGATDILSWVVTCRWAMEGYGTTANLNGLPLRLEQQGIPVEHIKEDFFRFTVLHELQVWLILLGSVVLFTGMGIAALRNLKK